MVAVHCAGYSYDDYDHIFVCMIRSLFSSSHSVLQVSSCGYSKGSNMAPHFPHVNKLVTPAMYAIQRTKLLIEVAAMRADGAGLMPFDNLADSPVYNSTADFVIQIVYHLNPHARFASWAMILLVHTLTQLGGNRWAELCVASRSFMQLRTPPVTARTSTQSELAAGASSTDGQSEPAAADPNIDESEPYSFVEIINA